ncbi:hypothetical protein [Rhizobium sp. SGZ-381]|uniref:hypothetical protein n=1 Tax=Rhizobium sp. SGZ-381 TaxID=3342800 RepID=UPI00366C96E2
MSELFWSSLFRFLVRSVLGLLLSGVLLSGCTPAERQFIEAGAGPDLMSEETAIATDSLESYFGEICRQADLPVAAGHRLRCLSSGFDEYRWNTVVKAGMNDIDHRCDLYLAWLENKRNERPFVNSTLVSLTTTAAGALAVAVPGNDDAFKYVSIALGLASQAYDAYYTRALLGLEPSTIKLTVESRRLQFRDRFLTARYLQKVDVVAVLRSYLKLCTPQTITMDVNSFARAAVTGVEPPQVENLEIERRVFDTPRRPNDPGIARPGRPLTPSTAVAQIFNGKRTYTDADLRLLRRNLCVSRSDPDNSLTMAAVKLWEAFVYSAGAAGPDGRINDTEWDGQGQLRGVRDMPQCQQGRYLNITESLLFQEYPSREKQFIEALKKVKVLTEGQNLEDRAVRNAVVTARQKCNMSAQDTNDASTVSKAFFYKVLEWADKGEDQPCVPI